jgi:hypothetical protein
MASNIDGCLAPGKGIAARASGVTLDGKRRDLPRLRYRGRKRRMRRHGLLTAMTLPRFADAMLWNFSGERPSKFLLLHNKLGLLSKFTEIKFSAAVGENSSTQALLFQEANSPVEIAIWMSVV